MKKITVKILVYNSHGADDGLIKNFNSLEDALDYIFEELDGEIVELYKSNTNEYIFDVEDLGRHIEYRITIEKCEV